MLKPQKHTFPQTIKGLSMWLAASDSESLVADRDGALLFWYDKAPHGSWNRLYQWLHKRYWRLRVRLGYRRPSQTTRIISK